MDRYGAYKEEWWPMTNGEYNEKVKRYQRMTGQVVFQCKKDALSIIKESLDEMRETTMKSTNKEELAESIQSEVSTNDSSINDLD